MYCIWNQCTINSIDTFGIQPLFWPKNPGKYLSTHALWFSLIWCTVTTIIVVYNTKTWQFKFVLIFSSSVLTTEHILVKLASNINLGSQCVCTIRNLEPLWKSTRNTFFKEVGEIFVRFQCKIRLLFEIGLLYVKCLCHSKSTCNVKVIWLFSRTMVCYDIK